MRVRYRRFVIKNDFKVLHFLLLKRTHFNHIICDKTHIVNSKFHKHTTIRKSIIRTENSFQKGEKTDMVPHEGQCGNAAKISRVERAVCVGDQGGNHTTPRKQIAYRGFFFRNPGVSFDEKYEPETK